MTTATQELKDRTITAVIRVKGADSDHDVMQDLSDAALWIECSLARTQSAGDVRVTVYEGEEHADGIAKREGWALVNYDSTGLLQIQRLDEANVFNSDEAAIAHVARLAMAGSILHQEAMSLHNRDARPIETIAAHAPV